MKKKGNKVSGEVIASKTMGLCSQQPMTLDQLVEAIYPENNQGGFNSLCGRVYHCVESLVETGVMTPVVVKGKLMFKYTLKASL